MATIDKLLAKNRHRVLIEIFLRSGNYHNMKVTIAKVMQDIHTYSDTVMYEYENPKVPFKGVLCSFIWSDLCQISPGDGTCKVTIRSLDSEFVPHVQQKIITFFASSIYSSSHISTLKNYTETP